MAIDPSKLTDEQRQLFNELKVGGLNANELEQLKKAGADERRTLPFHKALLAGELPLTMGGGIGQSRLSMLLLGKAHIGEVQVSLWDDETRKVCKEHGITLL